MVPGWAGMDHVCFGGRVLGSREDQVEICIDDRRERERRDLYMERDRRRRGQGAEEQGRDGWLGGCLVHVSKAALSWALGSGRLCDGKRGSQMDGCDKKSRLEASHFSWTKCRWRGSGALRLTGAKNAETLHVVNSDSDTARTAGWRWMSAMAKAQAQVGMAEENKSLRNVWTSTLFKKKPRARFILHVGAEKRP